jgi:uncharacterized membrane protein
MQAGDWVILVVIGGVFLFLGLVALFWGRYEEKKIFDHLAEQHDLREFTLKHVESPQPGALKMGGWLGIALGAALGIAALVVYLVA